MKNNAASWLVNQKLNIETKYLRANQELVKSWRVIYMLGAGYSLYFPHVNELMKF